MDPNLGSNLAGRFEVQRLLAEGTMGRVYLAIQQPIGRRVALKIMHIRGDQHRLDDFARRFTREAAVLGQLEHPNTVRIYDYGIDKGRFFLAMEYVEGPSLHDRMREGPMDPLRALDLVRQICGALHEAHCKGIVHRDLKPSNVLLSSTAGRDFVKVVDFGLVKVQDLSSELTQPGLVMGTPNYMAPEQIQGTALDRRVDLYALGVILYAMLTGARPYAGDSSAAILSAHLTQAPRPLREVNPALDLPPCLEWTVMRCLEKAPEDRFLDASELASALNGCEAALRYPRLRGLGMQLQRGRTVLPETLVQADDGFSGLQPIQFVTATESSFARAFRWALIAFIALGVVAIGGLALSRGPAAVEPPPPAPTLPVLVVEPAPVLPAPLEPTPAVEIEPPPVPAPARPAPARPAPARPAPARPTPARPAPVQPVRTAPAPVAAPVPAPVAPVVPSRPPPDDGSDLRDPFGDQR